MANCDCSTPTRAAPRPDRSATLEDFDIALSEARMITDIVTQLAEGAIGGTNQSCPSLFAWLGDELDGRLERIEVARMTLLGA